MVRLKTGYHFKLLPQRKQVKVKSTIIAHTSVSYQSNTEHMRNELVFSLYMFSCKDLSAKCPNLPKTSLRGKILPIARVLKQPTSVALRKSSCTYSEAMTKLFACKAEGTKYPNRQYYTLKINVGFQILKTQLFKNYYSIIFKQLKEMRSSKNFKQFFSPLFWQNPGFCRPKELKEIICVINLHALLSLRVSFECTLLGWLTTSVFLARQVSNLSSNTPIFQNMNTFEYIAKFTTEPTEIPQIKYFEQHFFPQAYGSVEKGTIIKSTNINRITASGPYIGHIFL